MPHNSTLLAPVDRREQEQVAEQAAPRPQLHNFFWAGIVGCLLLVAGAFRIVELNHIPGLNGDEAWSGVQAMKFLHGEPITWRTPTGNPLNVFFWGPLVSLHAVFPPSIMLLRSVAVASGLLALIANFYFCRRVFDERTATLSTVLLAVLPITIAYSRFAWDSSQTPLATVLVVYTALAIAKRPQNGWRDWATLALVSTIAVWIHPTNVFLLPLVVTCVYRFQRWPAVDRRLVLALIFTMATTVLWWRPPGDFARFVLDFGRLFSGATVYRFISGGIQTDAVDLSDAITWCVAAWAFTGFAKSSDTCILDKRLGLGVLLSLAAFYIVAGPHGVEPHFERYAIWTVVPVTLAVSRGIGWWLQPQHRYHKLSTACFLAIAAGLLVNFQRQYFSVFSTTGGDSHLTFRTAEIDPKQQVLQSIIAARESGKPATIASHNWWTRLPLQYLAAGDPSIQVVDSLAQTPTCFVELAGSDDERAVVDFLNAAKIPFHRTSHTDRAGRPVVVVFQEETKGDAAVEEAR